MSSTATTTVNPVCSSCALVDKCCVFTTTACIPTAPLHEELTVDELILSDPFAQILHLMCIHGFLWNPCSGPTGATNVGFTFSGLLAELQTNYPAENWDAEFLDVILRTGIQRGLNKKKVSSDGTEITYFANQNLLNVNPKNWKYEDVCSQLCAKKGCKAPSTLGGIC